MRNVATECRHLPYGITQRCHPTQVNALRRLTTAKQAGIRDLPTLEEWKAELTLLLVRGPVGYTPI